MSTKKKNVEKAYRIIEAKDLRLYELKKATLLVVFKVFKLFRLL